jgi:SSS family solute:Na+ symporter
VCGFLAVLAAVMSTLDAQLLTLSSMLTRDVLSIGHGDAVRGVRLGRAFTIVIALAVFGLWRLAGATIFQLASVAFSGYVTLVPTLFCGVRWSRFDATGAWCSILLGNAVYALCLWSGGGLEAASAPSFLGFLPVFWGLVGAIVGAGVCLLRSSSRQS